MTTILGCDPGINGALALIDTEAWTIALADMPLESGVKGKNMVSARGLLDLVTAGDPDHAFLEDVKASPQMGVTSAFSFGDGFGCTRTALLSRGAMVNLVRPQVWKTATRTPKDKKQATTRAAQLFPGAHAQFFGPRGGVMDGRAEAALLAFYGVLFLKFSPARALRYVEFPA